MARLLAASNAATAADAARTFNNPMLDAFSVAAAAAGRQVRAPDPRLNGRCRRGRQWPPRPAHGLREQPGWTMVDPARGSHGGGSVGVARCGGT